MRSLSPFQGGGNPRNLETIGKMQILRKLNIPSAGKGVINLSIKDNPMYVGIDSHTLRVEKDKKESKKAIRKLEDGLLLVVPAKIHGKPMKTLIDSRATRCFVTPSCVAVVGLKGISREIFLELGNGEKYPSRGYVLDILVVIVGLTTKIGLTVCMIFIGRIQLHTKPNAIDAL